MASKEDAAGFFVPVDQQENSLLMNLPQELRDEIFSLVFSTTTVASGHKCARACPCEIPLKTSNW
jgi:hypothetical protein